MEKKLKELEKRIVDLEKRPQQYIYVYPPIHFQPYQQYVPPGFTKCMVCGSIYMGQHACGNTIGYL